MCAALLGLMLVCSTMIFSPDRGLGRGLAATAGRAVRAAIEADVDVPVAGHFHGRHAGNRADLVHQFGSDFARRLAQLLGQLEGRRNGHLAEIALPRLLHSNRQVDAVANLDVGVEGVRHLFLNRMEHGKLRV